MTQISLAYTYFMYSVAHMLKFLYVLHFYIYKKRPRNFFTFCILNRSVYFPTKKTTRMNWMLEKRCETSIREYNDWKIKKWSKSNIKTTDFQRDTSIKFLFSLYFYIEVPYSFPDIRFANIDTITNLFRNLEKKDKNAHFDLTIMDRKPYFFPLSPTTWQHCLQMYRCKP